MAVVVTRKQSSTPEFQTKNSITQSFSSTEPNRTVRMNAEGVNTCTQKETSAAIPVHYPALIPAPAIY